jgi:cytochrome c oxidase cbb3-type subunit III
MHGQGASTVMNMVTRPLGKAVAAASFFVFAAILLGQHSYTPADIEDGGKLFRANCIVCHGPEGDQVGGVDLGHNKFRNASSEDGLIKIIRNGIAGTAMPPHNLSDFQAGTVVAYLRSMATAGRSVAVTGDPERGRAIFAGKGGCTSCHRANGEGSRVGPDLNDIAALRRTAEIEQSLLDPNAEVLAQNRYYRAVTESGEIVTGRLLHIDTFSVQILDSKERLRSLDRASLKESEFMPGSIMPSYKDKLSSSELADVIAYLTTLKGFQD